MLLESFVILFILGFCLAALVIIAWSYAIHWIDNGPFGPIGR